MDPSPSHSGAGRPDIALPRSPDHIVLLGPMGSGKTTLGSLLAERLGRPFVDSDEQLRSRFGLTGRQIEASSGVDALHAAEVEALIEALGTDSPSVIAAAGAVADSWEAMAALLRPNIGIVILESPVEVLEHRIRSGDHRRSVSREQLQRLTDRRREVLSGLAPLAIVNTSAVTPEQAVEQVMRSMSEPH
jgi:shikimate kinase